jgi:hypothetical protein
MRHALADDVVLCHEGALTVERDRHHRAQSLHAQEERPDRISSQVRQRDYMFTRCNQNVPFENRPRIQERDHELVSQHNVRGNPSGDDVAEDAVADGSSSGVGFPTGPPSGGRA